MLPNIHGDFGEVVAVFAFGHGGEEVLELVDGEEVAVEGGFLGAAELDALAFFDGLDVGGGFVEAGAGASIEPGGAATEA